MLSSSVYLPESTLDKRCSVMANEKEVEVELSASCYWVLNASGRIDKRQVREQSLAIVIGKPLGSHSLKAWSLPTEERCSFESVAVVFDDTGQPTSVSEPLTDVLICQNIHVDSVVFSSYKFVGSQ